MVNEAMRPEREAAEGQPSDELDRGSDVQQEGEFQDEY